MNYSTNCIQLIESNLESVKLISGYIIIQTPSLSDQAKIKSQVQAWYKGKEKIHFVQLFSDWFPITSSLYEEHVDMKLRWMKKRWGSCDSKGQVTLNVELIKLPKNCTEYVIVHELYHLASLNHSRDFYTLSKKNYPERRKTKYYIEHFMV